MVIKGSSRLIEQYFDEKGRPPLRGSGKVSFFHCFSFSFPFCFSRWNDKLMEPRSLNDASQQIDWHAFDESEMQWFYDRGCSLVKVEAEPGDLILWDSA